MKKLLLFIAVLLGLFIIYETTQIVFFKNDSTPSKQPFYPSATDNRKYIGLTNQLSGSFYSSDESSTYVTESLISSTKIKVIPDKYNTGCRNDTITPFDIQSNDISLSFVYGSNGGLAINLMAPLSKTQSILIENIDFSDSSLSIYNSSSIKKRLNIVFKNCKFSHFSADKTPSNVFCSFINCSFSSFSGSNATFDHCAFYGENCDGMNPFSNVTVNNSFFFDKSHETSESTVIHTDGVQIFGLNGGFSENIHFDNCRFELPQLVFSNSPTYINACIMLQLEYCSGSDYSFNDCIVNGGGYTIYAWSKNPDFTLSNCQFNNIKVGCLRKFDTFYPHLDEAVTTNNISDTHSLYVSSVFTDENGTHIITTNDTNHDRTLLVETDLGSKMFSLPACPSYSEVDISMTYEDFPFDVDCLLPYAPSWLTCYDITDAEEKQIRYVSFE